MILDESIRLCLLNDFYGNLLTNKQQEVLDLYINYNTPLVEISEKFNISRQGVLDTIKKAKSKLECFESKLGMLKKYLTQKSLAEANPNNPTINKMMNVWKN